MSTTNWLADVLGCLAEARGRRPEMRSGELLATVAMLAEDETGDSLWEVEDAEFAAALDRFAADVAHRRSDSADGFAAETRTRGR
jgi:hypothetical protein